jgi:CHRD domain
MVSVRRMPSPWVRATLPLVCAAFVAAGCGSTGSTTAGTSPAALDGPADRSADGTAVDDDESARLTAELTAEAEVPGPGDPDAGGEATVVVEPGSSQLCFRIEVQGIGDAGGTSVHEGEPGEDGAVVLGLDPPEEGTSQGCVTAAPALLDRVGRSPEDFYVNVRTDEHPEGAVRGQLTPA